MFRFQVELAPPVRPLRSALGAHPAPSEGSARGDRRPPAADEAVPPQEVGAPAGGCVSGRNAAATGRHGANGEFISTLDSEVYKYVKSALIVFSKTGKESIFLDTSNTLLTGAAARGRESRPDAVLRRRRRAGIDEGPEPY